MQATVQPWNFSVFSKVTFPVKIQENTVHSVFPCFTGHFETSLTEFCRREHIENCAQS